MVFFHTWLILFAQAEELIKKEMLTMLHYDALVTPTLAQQGIGGGGASVGAKKQQQQQQKAVITQAQAQAHLDAHPYDTFHEKDLNRVGWESKIVHEQLYTFLLCVFGSH